MLRDLLTLGDKIDIRHLDKKGKPVNIGRAYASQLVDFADFDVIYITAPINDGRTIILTVGEGYHLLFYAAKGLYQCNCVILSSHKENNAMITAVRITSNLEKFQRRQYFRLECIIDTEYRVITQEEVTLEQRLLTEVFKSNEERTECQKRLHYLEAQWLSGAITDISGGGARFNSSIPHTHGDRVRIKLDLLIHSEIKRMALDANVVSSHRVIYKSDAYEHRVEFVNIMQKEREDLIKYIFEQERKRRRNEKG